MIIEDSICVARHYAKTYQLEVDDLVSCVYEASDERSDGKTGGRWFVSFRRQIRKELLPLDPEEVLISTNSLAFIEIEEQTGDVYEKEMLRFRLLGNYIQDRVLK
jgi:hypothetical protein